MTPSSNQDGLIYFNNGSWSEGYIRLRWGDDVISNEAGTPDVEHQRTLVISDIEYVQNGTGWIMKYAQDFALFAEVFEKFLESREGGGVVVGGAFGIAFFLGARGVLEIALSEFFERLAPIGAIVGVELVGEFGDSRVGFRDELLIFAQRVGGEIKVDVVVVGIVVDFR